MALKKHVATTPSRRHRLDMVLDVIANNPEKRLVTILRKNSGRNNSGRVTVRHQGGRNKRFYRVIDFKRNKFNIDGRVVSVEYDPNRTANIALVVYKDGEKRYILSPEGLKPGDKVVSGEITDTKPGNAMQLKNIPVGTMIHNIEMRRGMGGKLVRSAGTAAIVMSRGEGTVVIKMPSGEVRMFDELSMASIGQLGNLDHSNIQLGKAGRSRHRGIRPQVRGVSMDPGSHPHGGGEGRSGIGMKTPKTVYGKKAVGKTRDKKKASNKYILSRKKKR